MAFPDPLAHIGRCHAIDADQQEPDSIERHFQYPLIEFEIVAKNYFCCTLCDLFLEVEAYWSYGDLSYVGITDIYLDRERKHSIPSGPALPRESIWAFVKDAIIDWSKSDAGQKALATAAEEHR